MKRFICFFAAVCLLAGLAYENENLFFSLFSEGSVSFYLTGELPDGYYANDLMTDGRAAGTRPASARAASVEIFKNGGGYIVVCDLTDYKTVGKQLSNATVSGVAISRRGDADAALDILNGLGADVVLKDELYEYGIICFYGYSKRLKNYINADGKKINIQIAVSGGKMTAGYPIILGSY